MQGKCPFIAAILFCLLPLFSFSQNDEIKFNLIEGNSGEPLGQINGISQDPYGYMWFSGQAKSTIYRYDGIRMVAIKPEILNTDSSRGNTLETIYADTSGMIWIGFFDGLEQYNPATGRFRQFVHSSDPGSIGAGMVSAILRDHLGRLWVGTADGLDLLDEKTGKFIHYKNEPGNPSSLSSSVVRSIYEDRKGVLWIGTGFEFPFAKYKSAQDGGLNRMDAPGRFARFLHDPDNVHSLVSNKVRAIFEDSRGILWIGTSGDGLHSMDRNTGVIERHPYRPDRPDEFSRPPIRDDEIPDPITFIKEDAAGNIWIGTYSSGMNRYDPVARKTTHYESSNGYPDKSCWTAFQSRDGSFWLSSTDQGGFLFRVDPFINKIKTHPIGNVINTLQADHQGSLWASGFGTGLLQFDGAGNLIHQYKSDAKDSIDLLRGVLSIFENATDSLWLGVPDGIVLLNKKSGKLNRLTYQTPEDNKSVAPPNSGVFQIVEGRMGIKWFATSDGLMEYNPANQNLKKYPVNDKDSSAGNLIHTTSVLEDSLGRIWAASGNKGALLDSLISSQLSQKFYGVNRLDPGTGQYEHFLYGYNVLYIYRDSENVIWAATAKNGIYKFNSEKNEFVAFFDPASGLNHISIVNIIEDDTGNLWLVTPSSIIKLDPDRKNYFIYGKKYGIRSNTLRFGASCKMDDEILIANNNGYLSFRPTEMTEKNKSFLINVTGLLVNNIPALQGTDGIIHQPIEKSNLIELKYNQNNLSFNFAATDFREPEATRYSSSLINFDPVWRDAGGDRSATYINVPPGRYIFKVKAVNVDGVSAEKSIQVIIRPPWWETWWAYIIWGFLFLVGAFFMNRFMRQRAISHERQKAQVKELEQAREIEKAYTELKSTQAQLIQSEKMASLGELTAGIAHEIQNPLNFVNNFSEINTELIDEMQAELNAGNKADAISLSNDIRSNQEKILQHGKRADSIVKGMLQHSRTNTGQKEPVDLNTLTDEYLRLSYHGIRARDKSFNVSMQTEFDEHIGKVMVVPQDIGRVLLNLFNNAFYAVAEMKKQSPPGYDPAVMVRTRSLAKQVEVSVKDNGIGISPKVLDKIFQPFFTTKPTGEGTGLGLSLSYDMIRSQGGDIRVESKEGQGAEFTIILPVS